MKIELTEKQAQRIAALIGAKNAADANLELALTVLADGVGLEKWTGIGLDVDTRTLTFVEATDGTAATSAAVNPSAIPEDTTDG